MIVKASVNRTNIYIECEELPNGNNLTNFASKLWTKLAMIAQLSILTSSTVLGP